MKRIVLVGAGLHALTCIDVLQRQQRYEIVGLLDSEKALGSTVLGYPVLGRQHELPRLCREWKLEAGFICLGDNWQRFQVYQEIQRSIPNFAFVNAIDPSVTLGAGVQMGQGNLLAPGCIVSPGTKLGNFCLLANGVKLGLQNQLDDFVSVSVASLSGGLVLLEEFVAITLGVTLVDRVRIGKHTVVGAGSLVLQSLPEQVLAYGQPAKIIRSRSMGEAYLKPGSERPDFLDRADR